MKRWVKLTRPLRYLVAAVAGDANVYFLSYERLKADIDGEIEALGAFLGGPAAAAANDPDTRTRVIEESSFDRMSKRQSRWASERPPHMPKFVRKGIVGDWAQHFSPVQLKRLLHRVERELVGVEVLKDWSSVLDEVRARCEKHSQVKERFSSREERSKV